MAKFKKFMAGVLAVSLIGCGLTACGGKKTANGDGVTVFEVWTNDSHSKATMEKLVDAYNKGEGKEKGIRIDYKIQQAQGAFDMAIESGDAPDFHTDNIKTASELDRIVPIESLPGGEEFLKQYDGYLTEEKHTWKGKTYTVPFYVTTFGMVYNKDMFKKYGLVDEKGEATPPKTYDELREYAKVLTNPKNQEYGIILPLKNEWFVDSDIRFATMANQGYMDFNPETGETDFMGYEPIVNMYMGIKADKTYYPDPEGIDNDTARAQFAEGNIGMKFAGSYDVGVYSDQFPAKCDWGVAPFPVADADVRYKARMAMDGYLCINKDATKDKDPEKVMAAYKFLVGADILRELYKDGKAIPYNWDIVKDIDLGDSAPTGWREFCELVQSSQPSWNEPGAVMTGQKFMKEVFLEDIWTGKVETKAALKDLTERTAKGRADWLAENSGTYKIEDYIVKDALKPVN